jgi:hypothetical protein
MNGVVGGLIFAGLVIAGILWIVARFNAGRGPQRPMPLPARNRRPAVSGAVRRRRPSKLTPHYVYGINLPDGSLWYIGFAEDLSERMHGHEDKQALLPDGHRRKWWHLIDPQVRRTYLPNWAIELPTEAAARSKEAELVRLYDPPGNVIKYRTVSEAA